MPGASDRPTRRIVELAWPLLIGQLAVMGHGVIDTVMAGRAAPADVAAVGLGASIYITVYVAAMGIVVALSPVIGQHYGAGRLDAIRIDFAQGLWLAAMIAVPGCVLIGWADLWLALSKPPEDVATRTRLYLWAVAAGLPGALFFRAFQAMTSAVARPKVLMVINLVALAAKVPLNAAFIGGLPSIGVPEMGGPGCGVATALIAWLSALLGFAWVRLDPWYHRLGLFRDLRLQPRPLLALLRLGIPIGASYLVEITSFTFMAIFVARLGATVGASHQIAANLAGVVFMLSLSISNAASVLAAQAIGASDMLAVRRAVTTGARMVAITATLTALALWALRGPIASAYSTDESVIAATRGLIPLVALFHVFDAAQTFCAYVLRAFKVVALPTIVYVGALWGIGLAGGWWVSFGHPTLAMLGSLDGHTGGAAGFWTAAIASLFAATAGLGYLLWRTVDRAGRHA